MGFGLGLASYTLRKFDLDQVIAMTQSLGLKRIALKSMHMPLNASDESPLHNEEGFVLRGSVLSY